MTRRAFSVAVVSAVVRVLACFIFAAAIAATIGWCMSYRAETLTLLRHFGRPGKDWYLDFLHGDARFIMKDWDVAVPYWVVPGWVLSLSLFAISVVLWLWSRCVQSRVRGFEVNVGTH